MLRKLLGLDDKVTRALEQPSKSYDISPNVIFVPANNDEPARPKNRFANSRMQLEDWSEKDEARLLRDDHHWEGYVA